MRAWVSKCVTNRLKAIFPALKSETRFTAVETWIGISRIAFDRFVKANNRLIVSREVDQRVSFVVPCGGIFRIEFDRSVEAVEARVEVFVDYCEAVIASSIRSRFFSAFPLLVHP